MSDLSRVLYDTLALECKGLSNKHQGMIMETRKREFLEKSFSKLRFHAAVAVLQKGQRIRFWRENLCLHGARNWNLLRQENGFSVTPRNWIFHFQGIRARAYQSYSSAYLLARTSSYFMDLELLCSDSELYIIRCKYKAKIIEKACSQK